MSALPGAPQTDMVSQEEQPHFALQQVLEVWILPNYCCLHILATYLYNAVCSTRYIPSLPLDLLYSSI